MNELTLADKNCFEALPTGTWHDCLFYDNESEEEFFVELQKLEGETAEEFIERCTETANDNFDEAVFCELVSAYDATMIGLDTY